MLHSWGAVAGGLRAPESVEGHGQGEWWPTP